MANLRKTKRNFSKKFLCVCGVKRINEHNFWWSDMFWARHCTLLGVDCARKFNL